MTPTDLTSRRLALSQCKRWVIKIGSSLLTDNGRGLDRRAIEDWAGQIAALAKRGHEVVVVSSGAVAAGMTQLGWQQRPSELHKLQAAAAVGQMELVQTYQKAFAHYRLCTAQILLDHDDLSNRERYLNARSTLRELLALRAIPVVNENDTVVTDEIRFGDNDTLAALVANLIDADALIILTDQLGMFDADPRQNALAKIIYESPAGAPQLTEMAGDGGALGRGGMTTKVRAARLAERSGAHTVVVGGRQPNAITRVTGGELLGTLLYADTGKVAARKRWLMGQLQSRGQLTLDAGAVDSLARRGTSLLPVGVTAVRGEFNRGDLVICVDAGGREVARGLCNYASSDALRIAGQPSTAIASLLGYRGSDEMIHRDNLVLVQ